MPISLHLHTKITLVHCTLDLIFKGDRIQIGYRCVCWIGIVVFRTDHEPELRHSSAPMCRSSGKVCVNGIDWYSRTSTAEFATHFVETLIIWMMNKYIFYVTRRWNKIKTCFPSNNFKFNNHFILNNIKNNNYF